MRKLPMISIVTPTWNADEKLFNRVLKELQRQTYPKKLIEHIVLDAGSVNDTVKIAKKYGCKVIMKPELKVKEQVRASLGIKMAKGKLVLILQSDNIITSKDWLERMVQPFLENKNVFCSYSAYNGYEKGMNATTRYGALFGSCEPTIYYLNKTEKIPMTQKFYNKGKVIKETENYYIVKFNKENLTTMGDNGHMFLKSAMDKVNKDPEKYVHLDAFAQLLKLKYDTYAVVKNDLIHMITPNIKRFVSRRVQVKDTYYDGWRGRRRYLVFDWNSRRDRINILKYLIYSFTFIYPFFESVRGYIKIKDSAWFLHPMLCFLMALGYSFSEVRWQVYRMVRSLR